MTGRYRNPDAHRVAHTTVRASARPGSTGRDPKTRKRLVEPSTWDLRLSDEKALERLRAWRLACREQGDRPRNACRDWNGQFGDRRPT
jgi:hypothetical protein